MIGWSISIHRQQNNRSNPAAEHSTLDTKLAAWQAGLLGINWILDLTKNLESVEISNKHYPSLYTAKSKFVIPFLSPRPPHARDVWLCDPDDILTEKWHGKTFIDWKTVAECSDEEWLLITAWDDE